MNSQRPRLNTTQILVQQNDLTHLSTKTFLRNCFSIWTKESFYFDSILLASRDIILCLNYLTFGIYNSLLYFHLCLNLTCNCSLLFCSHCPCWKYQYYPEFISVHITLLCPTMPWSHVALSLKEAYF
jgi:hypothetical protein